MRSKAILILIVLVFFVSTIPVSAVPQSLILEVSPRILPVRPIVNINDEAQLNLLTILNITKDIIVPSGGDFQAALNTAQFGDTIVLESGAAFTVLNASNCFLLPAKSGGTGSDADFITVRSSRADILSAKSRVSPSDAVNMPKIVALGSAGAICTQNNTRHWRFIGIEITNKSSGTSAEHAYTLIELGNYQTGVRKLLFDRVYVHPQEDGTTDYTRTATRGFGVNNVTDFTLTNSHVSGFMGHYQHDQGDYIDSEALATNVGDGYLFENNFLQAHFNTIFLGGGGTDTLNIGTVQSNPAPTLTSATLSNTANLRVGDYISFPQGVGENANGRIQSINGNAVTFSSLYKFTLAINPPIGAKGVAEPPVIGTVARWDGLMVRNFVSRRNTYDIDTANAQWEFDNFGRRMPKGYLEIKHCDTCSFDGDVFQGWPSYIALNAVNQKGDSPWTTIKDFSFRNCWIKNFSDALRIALGNPTGSAAWHVTAEGTNIVFENNLFTQTNSLPDDYGITKIGIWGYGNGVSIRHNTFINNSNKGGPMFSSNGPISNFRFQDNIAFNNLYGMNCGLGSFAACYPNWTEGKNVIVNNSGDVNSAVQVIYPNSFVSSDLAGVGFVDPANGNYLLSASSPYKGKATEGKDPGADIDALMAALGGGVSLPLPTPVPTATPSPTATPVPSPTAMPSPVATPTPTPIPTVCAMTVNNPVVPQWGSGKLVVRFTDLTQTGTVNATSTSGQVVVDSTPKAVSGTSMIAEFWLQAKKKSSSITVTGPSICGPPKTVMVVVQ